VLGLTIEESWPPRFEGSRNILPSLFKTMIDNNLLSTNMFSVVWPTEEREQGTLTFGGYDEDLLDGELISHSLFPENTTKWEVEIEGLTMTDRNNSKSILVDKGLPELRAFFLSHYPIIAFNYDLGQSLLKHMNTWISACFRYRVVDCDEVSSLPDITIRVKRQM
jgi:saccharopepsin